MHGIPLDTTYGERDIVVVHTRGSTVQVSWHHRVESLHMSDSKVNTKSDLSIPGRTCARTNLWCCGGDNGDQTPKDGNKETCAPYILTLQVSLYSIVPGTALTPTKQTFSVGANSTGAVLPF
jgi:hypothetical protein